MVFQVSTTTVWLQKVSLKSHNSVCFFLAELSKTLGTALDSCFCGPLLSGGWAPAGQGKAEAIPRLCCAAQMPGPCCPLSWAVFSGGEELSQARVWIGDSGDGVSCAWLIVVPDELLGVVPQKSRQSSLSGQVEAAFGWKNIVLS